MLFEDKVMYNTSMVLMHNDEMQKERILKRWECTGLSAVFIPARLLPNRNKSRHEWTQKTAFHILQRYESQDFKNSFSVYSDSESEKQNPDSDSEEEYFHDYTEKFKGFFNVSDNLSLKQEKNDYFHQLHYSPEHLIHDTSYGSPSKLNAETSDMLPGFSQNFTDSLDKGSCDNLFLESSKECSPENFITESSNVCSVNKFITESSNECSDNNFISESSNECSANKFITESSNECSTNKFITESSNECSANKFISESLNECSASNLPSEALDKCCDDTVAESKRIKEIAESVMLNENCFSGSNGKLNVVEAEFMYGKKKSNDDMYGKRGVTKKEKKNKSKSKNTMPLDSFWQTVDSDSFPQVDEFYESVMREQSRPSEHVGISSISEFPQLNTYPSSEKRMQSPDWNKADTFEDPLVERKALIVSEETKVKVEKHEHGVKILVIENIPEDIQEDVVVSLVSDYGQLKEMRKHGAFSTAEFWIPPDVELDWLISCFDGHQPFGAYSSVLHCYEKCR